MLSKDGRPVWAGLTKSKHPYLRQSASSMGTSLFFMVRSLVELEILRLCLRALRARKLRSE